MRGAEVRFSLRTAIVLALMTVLAVAQTPTGSSQTSPTPLPREKLDVPYVETPEAVVRRMLEMAAVKPGEQVIDLGSGDGRIPIMAAKEFGARALGIEIDPARIADAKENARAGGVADRVQFREQDLFKTDISQADVLTMYLLTSVNLKLRPRILSEMKPGARVVSHSFAMGEWQPDARDGDFVHLIYLWTVPARVDGRWVITHKGSKIAVRLRQNFQFVEGEATVDGVTYALRDARLAGTTLAFTVDATDGAPPRRFEGEVKGEVITAREIGRKDAPEWRLVREP